MDFAAARQAMIESQLKPAGVSDRAVLAAMARVPREEFVPTEAQAIAYGDRAIALGSGRSLMPPEALGILLDALLPQAGERAGLVCPAGGYSAAVLEAIGLDVDPGVEVDSASNAKGAYDVVLIDGAVEYIDDAIVALLVEGGRLGGALVENGVSRLVVGRKTGSSFGVRSIGDAAVPRLAEYARPRAFTF